MIDRISINIELPTENSLALLAPQKNYLKIFKPMEDIKNNLLQNIEERKKFRSAPKFIPAGQATQMIVGATGEDDWTIINRAEALYGAFDMKRVYYSGYVPVVKSKYTKGIEKVPLLREHRIYQADWLLRFYGFKADEILKRENPFLI